MRNHLEKYAAAITAALHNDGAGSVSESGQIKPNLDCIYTFLIGLAPNRIRFGAKSIGKL